MKKEIINYTNKSLAILFSNAKLQPGNYNRGLHSHNAVELMTVTNGEMICEIKNEKIILKPDSILLVNQNVVHWLYPTVSSNVQYIQIDISKYLRNKDSDNELFLEFLSQANQKPFAIFQKKSELIDIYNLLVEEQTEKSFGYEGYIKAYIYQLIAFMYRNELLADAPEYNKNISKLMPVIEYINKNYVEQIHLDDLTNLVHYDKFRLCKLFKTLTGSTVIEYINYVRLSKARELLLDNTHSISEISLECGFNSVQYFNKVFKNRLGCSPSEYKKTIM